MNTQPFKYSPALEDPKTLKESLIDREQELDRLMEALTENVDRKVNQHFLLVGPRGIGKSYLLLLLHHTVKGNIQWDEYPQTIKGNWCSALFAEEEYGVNSLSDILATILETLKGSLLDRNKTSNLIAAAKKDKDNVQKKVIRYLNRWKKSSQKKILLLVDNFQDILPHLTEKEQSSLRDILTNEDIFMMVGGAPSLFEAVTDYNKPFYHFFDSIRLEGLSRKEVKKLLKQKLKLNNKEEQLGQLKKRENRLDALIHLTGRNPRLVISLYKIVVEAEIPDVEEHFKQLLDDLTPYFQARLQNLSAQQREILDCIALQDPPINAKKIAQETGLKSTSVSSQLKRLKEKGLVKPLDTKGRKASYDLTEQLFRYWRQMRTEAGRKKLNFIVRFIEAWFTPEELEEQVDNLFDELLNVDSLDETREVVRELAYRTEALPSFESSVKQELIDIYDDIVHGNLADAEQKIESLKGNGEENIDIAQALFRGFVKAEKGNYSQALQIFEEKLIPLAEKIKDPAPLAISFFMKAGTELEAFVKKSQGIDELYNVRNDSIKCLEVLSETKEENIPPKLIPNASNLSLNISLMLSANKVDEEDYEAAEQLLDSAIKYITLVNTTAAQYAIGQYIKSILDLDTDFALQAIRAIKDKIEEKNAGDLEEFMKPYLISLEYLETKDDELLNKLTPELREIAEDIIERLDPEKNWPK